MYHMWASFVKMAARTFARRNFFPTVLRPNFYQKCSKTTKFDPNECVIVRQPAVATTVPSVSPFPLRLETYLRLANIPYKNRFGGKMSAKGKIPWMQYENDSIADSYFCIKYLNEKFSVDLDAGLSKYEKGVSRSLSTMMEENTYWAMVYYRWIEHPHQTIDFLFPTASPLKKKMIAFFGQQRVKQYLNGQGMGRHTRDEIYHIAFRDLEAASSILGDKSFIMGDKPTLVDSSAFGCLANVVWHDTKSPLNAMVTENFKNLEDYCKRMKEHVWPDWDKEIELRKAIALKK